MPKLLIITGSTRPGRAGQSIATWFAGVARQHGGFEVAEADLLEVALPLLDEPNHPRFANYTKDHTKAWSATVATADVIVWVTPEYNHSFPASVKNAIDYLNNEWRHKAVGIVSYGGIAAGTRAVQALKPVLGGLMMYVPQNLVNIPFFTKFMNEDGSFAGDDGTVAAANAMLDELLVLDGALSSLRRE